MIISIKLTLISIILFFNTFDGTNSEIVTNDPPAKVFEQKTCSTSMGNWIVETSGEWKDGVYVITTTCTHGGNKDCPFN
ncbi:MAG: hypothetical protein FH748_05185 [Balneolaceae bacterium]|nr:hypothetical protein [Balneolaceae bacterium]